MELVIRKRDDGYTMNGELVSGRTMALVLFFMFKSPQLDECVSRLVSTGELVLETREAHADPVEQG